MEAITATGASTLQVLRYGVVPQVIPPFLSFTIYRWDINVRMSTIIGFVGGGGIGYILKPRVDLGAVGRGRDAGDPDRRDGVGDGHRVGARSASGSFDAVNVRGLRPGLARICRPSGHI